MAVLNVTPDSFSDGGQFARAEDAIVRGLQFAREGAAWLDVGGESTRPGAKPVPADEQMRRVVPVIAGLRRALDGAGLGEVGISIDTTRAQVANAALEAGAGLVNDVSAGEDDGSILSLAAKAGAKVCLMHRQGVPQTMQQTPAYRDVVAEVKTHLLNRAQAAQSAGVARANIWLDPGIGFGKLLAHNLALMKALPELAGAGYPLLLGASRKRWIAEIMGGQDGPDPSHRLGGSLAATLWAAQCKVAVVRVHEVAPHAQALAAWAAIEGASVR